MGGATQSSGDSTDVNREALSPRRQIIENARGVATRQPGN
jgi:hypothetical protein